jgi:hypothetical protein
LEYTTGHIYQLSSLFLYASSHETFFALLSNDIAICSKLHKKFNPALTLALLKLLREASEATDSTSRDEIFSLANKHMTSILYTLPHFQVLCSELAKKPLLSKRLASPPHTSASLVHLRLQSKKPKELPSFNPFIDEEFLAPLIEDSKFKKKETERDIKRKTKKAEKDALRELRKDTV